MLILLVLSISCVPLRLTHCVPGPMEFATVQTYWFFHLHGQVCHVGRRALFAADVLCFDGIWHGNVRAL